MVVAPSSFVARPLVGCRIYYSRRLWYFAVSVPRTSGFVTQVEPSSLTDVILVHFCEDLDPPNLYEQSFHMLKVYFGIVSHRFLPVTGWQLVPTGLNQSGNNI
jgi:hypothetical protein